MKRPLLPPMLATMAGIILAEYIDCPPVPVLVFLAIGYLIILFTWRKIVTITLLFVWVTFFLLGFIHMELITKPPRGESHIAHHLSGRVQAYEGVITEISPRSDTGSLITVSLYRLQERLSYRPIYGRVLISVMTNQNFSYGDVIRFKTTLRTPSSFKNPGGFDYAKYLRDRGIWARGTISQPSAICILRTGYGSLLFHPFMNYREKLSKIISLKAPFPASSVIQACILGMQRNIPSDLMEKFNRTGTSHIIAISGFNMAIVAGSAALMARMVLSIYPSILLSLNLQLTSTIFASLFVLFYTVVAGAGISVIRATITILVFMFAILLGRMREVENTVAVAAIVILIFSPYLLFDLAFQLSFSAVYALILLTPKLMNFLPSLEDRAPLFRKTLQAGYGFLVATVSATLGTLPILLYHFHRLSPLVIVSNLLVVPILGFLVVPLSMLIMVIAPISEGAAGFIISLTARLVVISISIVDFLSSLPYSNLLLPRVGILQITIYVVTISLLISALGAKSHRSPKFIASGIGMVILVLSLVFPHGGNIPKQLEVTVLDVGQGQAIFIQLPDGKGALIDGGGSFRDHFDIGKHVVAPFLLHRGFTHLSRIVITHPHPDHIGGLLYILKNFPVGEIWANSDTIKSPSARVFIEEATRRAIPVEVVSAGYAKEEGVKWEILHPPAASSPSLLKDENDRSLVLRLTYGKTSFLFPGDISEGAESMLVTKNRPVKSDVLIVPHHGSRHSSSLTFIRKVKPLYACISVGRESRSLPHPTVLQRLQREQVSYYRTDWHGAVTFVSDGGKISVQTFSIAYD